MKPWLLRIHRWLALIFAAPLAVVVATGLLLSFEPWLHTGAIGPGSMTAPKIQAILKQHDPSGQARGIAYKSYDGTLTVGAGRGSGTLVDVATGGVRSEPSGLAKALGLARGLHQTLLLDMEWLVIASTSAMLALILIGTLMGVPSFANSVSGWHKGIAWGLLPLLVLSPLTGIFIAAGITFTDPPSTQPRGQQPIALSQAVDIVGRDHDLSGLVWLRNQRGNMLARIAEGGEYRIYAVTAEGARPMARNWPRLWHEGNFAGAWSAAMNVIISIAMSALLVTGMWIWLRRRLRRRANLLRRAQPAT